MSRATHLFLGVLGVDSVLRSICHAIMVGGLVVSPVACAEVLISPEEAGRPDVPTPPIRILLPGPVADLISPLDKSTVTSPFTLEINFRSFGSAQTRSIEIWYVKNPAASLTERVSKHLIPDPSNPNKLLFKQAEAPPGHHKIRIEMVDSMGRNGVKEFEFNVAQ